MDVWQVSHPTNRFEATARFSMKWLIAIGSGLLDLGFILLLYTERGLLAIYKIPVLLIWEPTLGEFLAKHFGHIRVNNLDRARRVELNSSRD